MLKGSKVRDIVRSACRYNRTEFSYRLKGWSEREGRGKGAMGGRGGDEGGIEGVQYIGEVERLKLGDANMYLVFISALHITLTIVAARNIGVGSH